MPTWATVGGLALTWPRWSTDAGSADILAIAPSALGFSLGAFAVLLAFTQGRAVESMAVAEEDRASPYERVAAYFTLLLVTYLAALVLTLVRLSVATWLPSSQANWAGFITCTTGALAYGSLLFSFASSVRVVLALFDLASVVAIDNRDRYASNVLREIAQKAAELSRLKQPRGKRLSKEVEDLRCDLVSGRIGKKTFDDRYRSLQQDFEEIVEDTRTRLKVEGLLQRVGTTSPTVEPETPPRRGNGDPDVSE